ncbi:TIGR01777 family oxidoreductase [Massilia sp. IC2-476]|uniref:TIGR01777 family oxidoreductase n=1 Tax=Massilia sp. IC2-476 TaxID=2887199 RepID=UPI001D121A79|nr:TIGR01777 family oxidoreductase [Massilia sp. IC2-476]MCC2974808.1 TIGR01777 family oxidoreductase [Massilia sp. IC2-476]
MNDNALRSWTIRWLYAVAAGHVLVGALLPWFAGAQVFGGYHGGIENAFWQAGAPLEARGLQVWWISLFGPTVQLMALFMIALIHLADRLRQPQVWLWMAAGLLLWAPQDILVSLRANVWPHLWIDLFALLVLVPPLLYLWQRDRAGRKDATEVVTSFDTQKRTVLVTGATGFIGQNLVRALLRDGHEVIALSRQPGQAAWTFDGQVRCIASMDALSPATRVDVVINLAGARILGPRWSAARKEALRRSRVTLTRQLVGWISSAEHKPFLLLNASAIGYYGIQKIGDATALDEDAPPQPVFMSDLCREWEEAAGEATRYGVQVECMRFGLVLGKGGALPMMLLPILLGVGGRLGSGRQWLSWIHVDDVLRAIAHRWRRALVDTAAAEAGATNFTAPESVTQAEFSRIAARTWRRPSFLPTPGWPMRLALGEQADLLLEGQRVVPRRLEQEGFVFRYPTLASALQSLR